MIRNTGGKKHVIIIGVFLCFFIAFIIGGKFDRSGKSEMAKSVELIETVERAPSNKSIIEQSPISPDETSKSQENSGETEEDEEEKTTKTAIDIHDSFVQIETNSIHKRIAFPSIDITNAEDVANSINEQIYHEIIPEDFWVYGNGREETDVQYEIESVGEEIVSIHFHGYQSYMGSYAEYNKGMNFDLRTGKIISLRDYYTLSDIKAIIMNARDRNEISILDFPVNEEEIEQEIDSFVQLFDSEEYVNRTDIFFLKDNHIYFIAPPPESMRQSIYMELSLDKFSNLQ